MHCVSCGHESSEVGAKFCPECGSSLADQMRMADVVDHSSTSPSTPKTCAAGPCQEYRLEGSDFCGRHGPREMPQTKLPGAITRFFENMEAKEARKREQDSHIHCIYCRRSGSVTTLRRRVKRGVSGAKATGALATGGLSIFATGLSRKQDIVEARCSHCGMSWQVEADR